jgi:hypothetical protein
VRSSCKNWIWQNGTRSTTRPRALRKSLASSRRNFLPSSVKRAPPGGALLERIQRLLAVALRHGHDSLVLGAWGCGVFRNDQTCVAQWFRVHLTNSRCSADTERKRLTSISPQSVPRFTSRCALSRKRRGESCQLFPAMRMRRIQTRLRRVIFLPPACELHTAKIARR